MKHLYKKFHEFLDKEFEIPLPKRKAKKQQYIKQPPNYVNPFKHQHELEAQRLKQQKELAQQRLARELQEAKRLAEAKIAEKAKKAAQGKPPQPTRTPSVLDKKIEFTIKKPKFNFKKPNLKMPTITKVQPKNDAIEEVKTPHTPAPELKAPAVHAQDRQTSENKITQVGLKKLTAPLKHSKKHTGIFTVILAGLLLFGAFAYSGFTMPFAPEKPHPTKTAQGEQEELPPAVKLAEAVGKKIKLPADEEPVSATVTDRNSLQDQKFFQKALNGDKILMYKQNKKAYLYRPSTDEVIAVAPLNFQETAGAATSSAEIAGTEPETTSEDPNAQKLP